MANVGFNWDTASTTNRQNQKTESSRSSTTTAGSTATRVRAREDEATRAAMLHGQYVDCCTYYAQSFHRGISPGVQRAFATRIREGMSADVIRAAIDETMRAPRPSWAYCEAILRNLDNEQVRTIEQWEERKRRHQSASNPALNYQQREYTEDMFGEDFFVNLDSYGEEGAK